MHHIENLIDFAHTYFIHKNQLPFRNENYAKSGPFLCKQYKDKRGFLLVVENYGYIRFEIDFVFFSQILNALQCD